jgi:hypothetical protein
MNWNQNLFDIIGILIGFISIILFLSLIVTSLVQATTSSIRLRARNLKKGLTSLINNVFDKPIIESKNYALKVLNAKNVAVIGHREDPTKLGWKLLGPVISYIKKEELPEALKNAGLELNGQIVTKTFETFDRMWNQLDKRFLLFVRLITLGWAVAVAVYFQVSAPELLKRLSVDDNLRASITAEAQNIVSNVKKSLEKIGNYQNISQKALIVIENEYPNLKEKLEDVSGNGSSKESLLNELELVLADEGNIDDILQRYDEILENLYKEKKAAALDQAYTTMDVLSKFNITAWSKGGDFYIKNGDLKFNNIIGVLITAALLSFGAPFWFDRLQDVLKLRDMLSKGIKQEDKDKNKKKKA